LRRPDPALPGRRLLRVRQPPVEGLSMGETLRVTTLDEAFLNLSARAVMSIQFEVRVAGRLDADRLAGALRSAIARHPLARARLAPAAVGALRLDWQVPDTADHLGLEITGEPIAAVRSRL